MRNIIIMMLCLLLTTLSFAQKTSIQKPSKIKHLHRDQVHVFDVNKATVEELVQIKGLTPFQARSLTAYRQRHGYIKDLKELRSVRGFKRIKDSVFNQLVTQLKITKNQG